MKLNISEIFYSLQGEGARTGVATFFIRLQGCSAKYACYQSGIICDTEFESGKSIDVSDVMKIIQGLNFQCKEITWTGGEPLDQLSEDVINYFKEAGYYQAIETSGVKPAPSGIDFICVSPKVAEHVIKKNFPDGVDELRYVRHRGQSIPEPAIKATYYWISPHFDGNEINTNNLNHCINLCKENPQWRLSIQNHKLLRIL